MVGGRRRTAIPARTQGAIAGRMGRGIGWHIEPGRRRQIRRLPCSVRRNHRRPGRRWRRHIPRIPGVTRPLGVAIGLPSVIPAAIAPVTTVPVAVVPGIITPVNPIDLRLHIDRICLGSGRRRGGDNGCNHISIGRIRPCTGKARLWRTQQASHLRGRDHPTSAGDYRLLGRLGERLRRSLLGRIRLCGSRISIVRLGTAHRRQWQRLRLGELAASNFQLLFSRLHALGSIGRRHWLLIAGARIVRCGRRNRSTQRNKQGCSKGQKTRFGIGFLHGHIINSIVIKV